MALFGDIGKFFTKGAGAVLFPVAPITQAAGKVITGDLRGAQKIVAAHPFTRSAVAAKGLLTNSRRPTETQTAPGYQQLQNQFNENPGNYFQPVQFSGGSYDPGLGGGAPSWDFSTPYSEGATQQAPSWVTSDWGTWG